MGYQDILQTDYRSKWGIDKPNHGDEKSKVKKKKKNRIGMLEGDCQK